MKRSRAVSTVLVLFGTALACSPAWSQPGRGGGGSDPYRLLRIEQVQKEVDLLDEQKAELKQIAEKTNIQMREMFAQMGELGAEQRREKILEMREKMEKRSEELRGQVEKVLLPFQIARLKEINIQVQGVRAFSDPEVVRALEITEPQKRDIEEIQNQDSKDLRSFSLELRGLGAFERSEKMAEIREKMSRRSEAQEAEILEVLTDKQKRQWEKMKGEKFEFDRSQFFRPPPEAGRRPPT